MVYFLIILCLSITANIVPFELNKNNENNIFPLFLLSSNFEGKDGFSAEAFEDTDDNYLCGLTIQELREWGHVFQESLGLENENKARKYEKKRKKKLLKKDLGSLKNFNQQASLSNNGNDDDQQSPHQQSYAANNGNDDCVCQEHNNSSNNRDRLNDKSKLSSNRGNRTSDQLFQALDAFEKKRILQQKIKDIWKVQPNEHLVSRLDKNSGNKKLRNKQVTFHTDSWITNYERDNNAQESYYQQDYAANNGNDDDQQHDNSSNNRDGLDNGLKLRVSLQICQQLEKKSSVQRMENGRSTTKSNHQQNYAAHNGNDDDQQHDNSNNNRDGLDNSSRQIGRLPSLQDICRK